MAQRLGTSVFDTIRLVGCSRSAVTIIYENWINDSETSSSSRGNGLAPGIIEKHLASSQSFLQGKAKSVPDSGSAGSPVMKVLEMFSNTQLSRHCWIGEASLSDVLLVCLC